ncbi:MAG TPA: head-tail connector protein, partial [Hyphomicrobium sp.]|nr:head-tail connector protein [Hyphomicrobium sp.]
MALVITSAPAVEPVTVSEAKAHLRVDGTAEDTLIGSLILTSRLHIEAALGLALMTQSWRLSLDAWPNGRELELPL